MLIGAPFRHPTREAATAAFLLSHHEAVASIGNRAQACGQRSSANENPWLGHDSTLTNASPKMTKHPSLNKRLINFVRTGPRGRTPVVLVHPVGLDLTYWSAQIETLGARHDVLAFDLPGHGRTPGRPEDWTFAMATDVLEQVVLDSGAGHAHIVGLSVGGMIAQAFALAKSRRARSLTLIGTAATFGPEVRAGMRARAATVRREGMQAVLQSSIERWLRPDTVARRPDLVDRIEKTLLADDALIHAAMWDMIAELDLASQLPQIDCPTLILVGEFDPSTPPTAAEFLLSRINDARMHVIPDASHMAPFEKPDAVNAHLLSFLAQVNQTD